MAGYCFLKAFLPRYQARSDSPLTILVDDTAHGSDFAEWARQAGCRPEARMVDCTSLASLARTGCVHLPVPGLADRAWQRNFLGAHLWSITGITHTTASQRIMQAIGEFITAPVQSWDALICTSSAVKGHVEQQLQATADHLRARLGIQKVVLPQLPVIPLGVICEDFAGRLAERPRARASLALTEQNVAVLFMGRLSYHAKAHPVPMYLALERAQAELRQDGIELVLLEYGQHGLEAVAEAYRQAQRMCCPSVRCIHLDGREPDLRQQALAAADIFCSLSDNIQEAFGLTPLEAKAAGLPLIVSDWDGYRDTVRHGTDGYRIATAMPEAGMGNDLAFRHATDAIDYDQYVSQVAAVTSVDIDAVVSALLTLARNPRQRLAMGTAASNDARSHYDWNVILESYEELWSELEERRLRDGMGQPNQSQPWPARLDPFTGFQGYASTALKENSQLELGAGDPDEALQKLKQLQDLACMQFSATMQPTPQELAPILNALAQGHRGAGELAAAVYGEAPERWALQRNLAWLIKMGLLRFEHKPAVKAGPRDVN